MRTVFRDDHEHFREQARRFIAREIVPHYDEWEAAGITPAALWQSAGAEGLLNCALPEPYGGGGDFGHSAVVIEELAKANCMGIGFSVHSDMVAPYIHGWGSISQKKQWLPGMASGEIIGAVAMTEPDAGSDLKRIRTRATRTESGYLLNGQKTFITNGANAGMIIVAATTDPDLGAQGLSLFCMATDTPGVTRGKPLRKIGLHSQDVCEVFMKDVALPADSLLGELNNGFSYLMTGLPQERLSIALCAGASLGARLDQAVTYAQQRKVFGRRVIDHQNTRFKLADARSRSTMLNVFLDDCLARHLADDLDGARAAVAKLQATELQCQVLDDLLQIYGGYGYMSEYGIGRAWCDARAMRIYGGTSEIMREIIGRIE